MVDRLVMRTAKALAGAFYDGQDVLRQDVAQRSERFRNEAPDAHTFRRTQWPRFVPMARKTLAHMLNEPGRPQREKDEIFDALLNDRKFMTDTDIAAPSIIRIET